MTLLWFGDLTPAIVKNLTAQRKLTIGEIQGLLRLPMLEIRFGVPPETE